MRQDKTFARILLIFSIANVVLAAPAVVRQRRFVTDRTDVRVDGRVDAIARQGDRQLLRVPVVSYVGFCAQGPPPSMAGSLHQDSAPVSVAPQLNDPAPVSGTSELHNVPPFMSGNLPSQHDPPRKPNRC
jgi:hypothetical protein